MRRTLRSSTSRTAIGGSAATRGLRLRSLAMLLCLITIYCAAGGVAGRAGAAPAPVRPPTVVSLTFDDGFASQLTAQKKLAEHDMHGTFYVPSGFVGAEGRLTADQVRAIQHDGNEIGGHSINHLHLPALDTDEQARQICDDRVALSRMGLRVTSFAYPFASFDARTEQVVKSCGYNSARAEEGLSSGGSCAQCPIAESTTPVDRLAMRTAAPVVTATPLAFIEDQIDAAVDNGGGWVPLVFHEVCTGCSQMAITPTDFEKLLAWLQARRGVGVTVRTVDQVIGNAVQAPVSAPISPRPDGLVLNTSLEVASSDGKESSRLTGSECWQQAGYGTNEAKWSRVRLPHSGSWAEQVTVDKFASGDQKLIVREDSGSCAPRVQPGRSYRLSGWYTSTAQTRVVVFYRKSNGSWVFWAESPPSEASPAWMHITWQTPPVPADATRLSFGLNLAQAGTLTVDDYAMSPVSQATWPVLWILLGIFGALAVVPTIAYVGWIRLRDRRRRSFAVTP